MKNAKLLLEESEQRYRDVVENSIDGIYTVDLDGIFTLCNNAMVKILGQKTKEDVIGKSYALFTNEKGKEDIFLIFHNVLKERVPRNYCDWNIFLKQTKEVRNVELSVSPICRDKKVIGFNGILRDVTDIKKAQELLKESEEKYRKIFDSANDSIIIMDRDIIIDCNRNASCMFGCSRKELIGQPAYNFWPEYQPSGRLSKEYSEEKIRAALKGDKRPFELRHKKTDGTFVDTCVTLNIFEWKGKKYLQSIIMDITETKQANDKLADSLSKLHFYKQVLEEASQAIFVIQKGIIVEANKKFLEQIKITREEIIGKPFLSILSPEQHEIARDKHIKRMKGEDPGTQEYPVIATDGTVFYVCLFGSNGIFNGEPAVVYFALDITKQKKLEAALNHAQKMESVGTLSGGLAHNFNNLLLIIQGNTTMMLLDTKPNDSNRERLLNIQMQIQNGSKITKQLLSLTRNKEYNPKPTDLNESLNESLALFNDMRKDVTIHKKFDQKLWPVNVDHGQINQVLLNIYNNAWQAMTGNGELYLDTGNEVLDEHFTKHYKVPPGKYVRVSITDTGSGMDEKTMEKIFDPFFTTKEEGEGTGLGLATVYGTIVGHAGFIKVDSKLGHGSTFNIYLPIANDVVIIDKTIDETIHYGKGTLLLIDDEQSILDLGKDLSKLLGYEAITKSSGKEAIEFYQKNWKEIDLVILDMIMPEMNGSKVLSALRLINPNVKVIISSGYPNTDNKDAISNEPSIQKPYLISTFSKKIQEVLGKK